MNLRYIVARLIPDLVREEPINVGIILQSEEWVGSKFIERIPKDWELPLDLESDVAVRLSSTWEQILKGKAESIYDAQEHKHKEIKHTDRPYLEWLRQTHSRHLQFSDVRGAEVEVGDHFDFDTFLLRLYNIFVAPKPRMRKP